MGNGVCRDDESAMKLVGVRKMWSHDAVYYMEKEVCQ